MKRVVLCTSSLFAVAGCGAQAQTSSADKFSDPDQKAVAEKIEDLENAGGAGRPTTSARTSSPRRWSSQLDAAGTDCATEMQKAIDDATEFDLDVQKVTINGNEATAEVKQGDDGPTETMNFTKENGDWRATALSEG